MLEVWHLAFISPGWNSLHCLHLHSSTQTPPYPYSLGGTAACPPAGPVSATGNSELAFRTATSMQLLTDQNAQVWHLSHVFYFYVKIHLPYHSRCFLAGLATNSPHHVETQGHVREFSSPRATSEGPYCQDCTSLESLFETVPSIPFMPVWMLVPLKKLQPQGLGVQVRCDVRPRMDSLCVRLHIQQKIK